MSTEYRVIWQREGQPRPMTKVYRTKRGADTRYGILTSAEPWALLGHDANDYVCCSGHSCGCEGLTRREQTKKIRAESPLKFARLETREVGEWTTHSQQ